MYDGYFLLLTSSCNTPRWRKVFKADLPWKSVQHDLIVDIIRNSAISFETKKFRRYRNSGNRQILIYAPKLHFPSSLLW